METPTAPSLPPTEFDRWRLVAALERAVYCRYIRGDNKAAIHTRVGGQEYARTRVLLYTYYTYVDGGLVYAQAGSDLSVAFEASPDAVKHPLALALVRIMGGVSLLLHGDASRVDSHAGRQVEYT